MTGVLSASFCARCFKTTGICSKRTRTNSGSSSLMVYRIGIPPSLTHFRKINPPPCSFGKTDNCVSSLYCTSNTP